MRKWGKYSGPLCQSSSEASKLRINKKEAFSLILYSSSDRNKGTSSFKTKINRASLAKRKALVILVK
jgi:hypothetical protein